MANTKIKKEKLSECCNAPMVRKVQCEVCGSDGKLKTKNTIQIIPEKKLEWHEKTVNLKHDKSIDEYISKLGKGWRMPTRVELLQAYIDKVEGFEKGYYWSADLSAANPDDLAWLADFDDGYVGYNGRDGSYCVRPVRRY
jgi:hypothetical protein